MTDSSQGDGGGIGAREETLSVPSSSFFEDIKFYTSGNVSEKVFPLYKLDIN